MRPNHGFLLAVVVFAAGACSTADLTYERLNGIAWTQTSLEHEMLCVSTYRRATEQLDAALRDSSWTATLEQGEGFEGLPPAVILDVDETVLDNSPMDARHVKLGIDYDQRLWDEWVRESRAESLPGADVFVAYAKARGVAVFFVTNRGADSKSFTLANLQQEVHPTVREEELLCRKGRPEWGWDKTTRRAFLAGRYRILLLIGDDYNDFASLGRVSPEERRRKAEAHVSSWGVKWILLPNTRYGSWQKALYGYDRSLSLEEKRRRKIRALRTGE